MQALADHKIIRGKRGEADELDRHEAAEGMAKATHAEVAQGLGYTLLRYLSNPDGP